MNNEDQESQNLLTTLTSRIDAASSVKELRTLLAEVERNREQLEFGEANELARNVFRSIANLTSELPDVASAVIRDNLLPWCLSIDPQGESSEAAVERYRLRQLLKEWIYAYPHDEMMKVRSSILKEVRQQLESTPSKELLWVISTIGFRTAELTELLWPLLDEDGDLADVALSTLSGLGAEPNERERLLNCVRRRLAQGNVSAGVRIAIQELAGPDQAELAFALLKLVTAQQPSDDHHDLALAFSVATNILDRCADDTKTHDGMWAILRKYPGTVQMTHTYAYRCDTRETVADYINWLVSGQVRGDVTFATYVSLTTVGELAKPRQLQGWETPLTAEFFLLLERCAKSSTRMKGRYTTTDLRAKVEAWKTALTLGCANVTDWIDEAVMDEINHYAAHSIATIVACLRTDQLPKRLLDAITDKNDPGDDGQLLRQMGLIEIARSCSSRAAFEALLRFGLTNEGNVLLSTVDAITDVAIARLEKGDADIIDRILEATTPQNEHRHRVAAISVFCRLCIVNRVSLGHFTRLWELVNADDLDNYARCEAMEAIGLIDSAAATAWCEAIKDIARENESDLGWRACEVLIRQHLITPDDEQWLFFRLGLNDCAFIWNPKATNNWQAFLIGLLFLENKDRYSRAVSGLFENAATNAVYRVLESLRHHARDCPSMVCESLARRIQSTNDRASADTELFRVLAEIAPDQLLKLSREPAWKDWLVEARAALVEAIRYVATEHAEYRLDAVASLVPFMQDAAFQVRRSAYRAIASEDVHMLETVCEPWSRSTDVELRKRAAEASEWLPTASHSDGKVSAFGFGWDTEPSVREIWKDVLVRRRERLWASDYLDRVFASCEGDDTALPAYRFARALTNLGDDESISRIEKFVDTRSLRPHVGHWLEKTANDIKNRWKKVTDKWPEPWANEQGSIEELEGEIVLPEGKHLVVKLSLWCLHRRGQSDLSSWGGIAEQATIPIYNALNIERIELRLPGRAPAFARVFGSYWSSGSAARLVLRGDGPYPAKMG